MSIITRSLKLNLLLFFFFYNLLFPGTTGKISGIVRNIETEDPLIGVNVALVSTPFGAVTDETGRFALLNIPPGNYQIQASMMGYSKYLINDLSVGIDQTTQINIPMSQESIKMKEVIVQASKPIIQLDISNSQFNVSSDEIMALPIDEISDILDLQAGVNGLSIRGGGTRESLFRVDGFSYNDERSNIPYTSIPIGIIKEIQVQTGGFNAEYGNIRSGVINVVLAEGDENKVHGGITFRHSPPAQKHFGNSLYSSDSYFFRPFLDNDVSWVGTENGNWDAYTRRQYPSFEGWNAIADATLQDDDKSNDLTPASAQQIFKWQHRRNGVIQHPDENMDLFVSGPVPFVSELAGNLRFLFSYRNENEAFIFPLSYKDFKDNSWLLKLTSDFTKKTKINFSLQKGQIQSISPYSWKTTPTGTYLRTSYEVANLLNSSSGNSMLFMPGYYSPTLINRSIIGINLTHMFSEKKYLEFSIQYQSNDYNTFQMELRDTTKTYIIIPGSNEIKLDEAPFGYWGYAETGIDGMGIGGWMNLGRDESVNSTTIIDVDYINQIGNNHHIKSGAGAILNSFKIRSFTESPSMSTWNRSMIYDTSPYRLFAYIQDKIEYKGFISNIGIRSDISSGNSDIYDLGEYDDYFKQGNGHDIEENVPSAISKPIHAISPRLGISHPITDKSKLYFNYGHFYSEPSSSYRFRLQRESNGLVTHIGDPGMEFEKTIAYETGYSSNLLGRLLLNVALYYKDITNQPGWVYYQNMNGTVQVNRIENNNYEDIRGLEITLNKKLGNWITGMVNYTYQVESSGYFGLLKQFQDPNVQRDYESLNQYQSKPRPRPYLKAVAHIRSPNNFGPKIFGQSVFGNWASSFIFKYNSGGFETYNPQNLPGVSNNIQWKGNYTTDARFSKKIQLQETTVEFLLDVKNLFNNKFISYAGFADYYDYIDYLESLRFSWEEGKEHGIDRIGEYRTWDIEYQPYEPEDWQNPTAEEQEILDSKAYIDMPNIRSVSFLNPRDIYFGISVYF